MVTWWPNLVPMGTSLRCAHPQDRVGRVVLSSALVRMRNGSLRPQSQRTSTYGFPSMFWCTSPIVTSRPNRVPTGNVLVLLALASFRWQPHDFVLPLRRLLALTSMGWAPQSHWHMTTP
jgi:hypothetical protein